MRHNARPGQSPLRCRRAYAMVELPLVLCLLIAVAGIAGGTMLWYRNGVVTTGALVCFSLTLPFLALLTAVLLSGRRRG